MQSRIFPNDSAGAMSVDDGDHNHGARACQPPFSFTTNTGEISSWAINDLLREGLSRGETGRRLRTGSLNTCNLCIGQPPYSGVG